MKTKKALIEELREFHSNLRANGMLNRHELQGIVIIIYSPQDLGSDDDMWHMIVNYYDNKTAALDRYANTSATSSRVIIWSDSMCWNGFTGNVAIEIDNIIEEINQYD